MHASLSREPLPEILHTLHYERQSGILQVSRDEVAKRIYFGEGSMVFAGSDLYSDRLGEFLVRQGRMTRSQLADASNKKRASGQRLGKTLVAMGLMSEKEMRASVAEQVRDIIYSLFSWNEGEHEFESRPNPISEDLTLELPRVPIILEGIRRVEDPDAIREALGDLHRVVSYSRNPWLDSYQMNLTPEEGFVLSRVDGQSSLAEIVSVTPLEEEQTLRCLYGLVSAGFLEFGAKSRELSPKETRKRPIERFHAPPPVAGPVPVVAKVDAVPFTVEERRLRDDISEKRASLAKGSYYQWLGVQSTASPPEIRKAYSALIKRYHPDRQPSPALRDLHGELEEIVAKLMEAYGVLSDPLTRRRYDNSLRTEAPRGESVEPSSASATSAMGRAPTPAEKRAVGYYREALRSFDRADFHRTVRLMEEAVELAPKAAYHRLLARALSKNPKWRRAGEEHFQKALDLEPFDVQSYIGLGELYESAGLWSRARTVFAKALELDPANDTVRSKLGSLRR